LDYSLDNLFYLLCWIIY